MKEITRFLLDGAYKEYIARRECFKYSASLGRIARHDKQVSHAMMPVFWGAFFDSSEIISVNDALARLNADHFWVFDVEPCMQDVYKLARLQNTFCAFIRELEFCYLVSRINPSCRLFKNLDRDLSGGADIIIELDGKQVAVGVFHMGSGTDEYREKKSLKAEDGLYQIDVANAGGDGIHLPFETDVRRLLDKCFLLSEPSVHI